MLKLEIRIVTSINDGTNFTGYVPNEFLDAHGISKDNIQSWSGEVLIRHRPEQCIALIDSGEADTLLQEAIMTPWWRGLVESNKLLLLPTEASALNSLQKSLGLSTNNLTAGCGTISRMTCRPWTSQICDFVRDDLPKEVASLLIWCLVETMELLEGQYNHLTSERNSLTYSLDPKKMAQTTVTLHDGTYEDYSKSDSHTRYQPLVKASF
ncbi:hypothetical protein BGW36DRAFT_423889 [Talaromyces proteolyticus]|uniref:Uncharacterized protein n=1 Tax=Talaromyces proteolyticus TaxID=1131652 RepID=A0AAD4L0F9_9EURO|nr:uncharacterized protein BGW36DRAFT_423889 [Talaromyces proteolyticus]KAH8701580.1 hypothetical protein BGW36DRAFT_423889 [Talaromyces proteolyticus]